MAQQGNATTPATGSSGFCRPDGAFNKNAAIGRQKQAVASGRPQVASTISRRTAVACS